MKKCLNILLALVLTAGLTSCQSKGGEMAASNAGMKSPVSDAAKKAGADETAGKDGVLNLGSVSAFEKRHEGLTLVYDTLTRLDMDYHAHPQLITAWKVSDDHTKYVLDCREGLTFHDGTRVTPEDWTYSIQKYGKVDFKSYDYVLKSVEAKGDKQIEVDFTAPYMYLMEDLSNCPLVKKGSWSDDGQMTRFVGTGPFVYKGTDAGEMTTLERSPNYWNKDYKTDVKTIHWYAIPDEQTRKLALISGKVDALGVTEHYISMPYSVVDELLHNGAFHSVKEPNDKYTSVGAIMCNWKAGVLKNKTLRRALEKLVNRDEIVKTIFFGIPDPCGHIYNPGIFDGPKQEKPVVYDPEGAKALLKEAGYTVGDERQPCVDKDGKPLKLRLVTNTEEHQKDLGIYLQGELKRYGIDVDVQSLKGSAARETLKNGEYELYIGHPWFAPLLDCLGYMGLSDDYSEYGLGFAVNDEMKKDSEAYIAAATPEEAQALAQKIWRIQYDEAITIPIFSDLRYVIADGKYQGFHFDRNVFQIDLNGVTLR